MDLLRMSRLTRGHRCTANDHVLRAGAARAAPQARKYVEEGKALSRTHGDYAFADGACGCPRRSLFRKGRQNGVLTTVESSCYAS